MGHETKNYFFGESSKSRKKIIPNEKPIIQNTTTEEKSQFQTNYQKDALKLKNNKKLKSKKIKGESIQQRNALEENKIRKCIGYIHSYSLSVAKLKENFNKILGTHYPVDNNVDIYFLRLVKGYQSYYNRNYRKKISVDGILGPSSINTLRTVFKNETFTYNNPQNNKSISPQKVQNISKQNNQKEINNERIDEDKIRKCKNYIRGYVLSVSKLKNRFNKTLGTHYPVDNNVDSNFIRLVEGYQSYYNRRFKKKLSVDGILGPNSIKTLRTVFNNEDFKERVERLTNEKIQNTKNQSGKQEKQYGFTEGAKKVLNGIRKIKTPWKSNQCGMFVGNALVAAGYNEFNRSGRSGYKYEDMLEKSPNFKKIRINHPNEAPIGAVISYEQGFGSPAAKKHGHVEIKTKKAGQNGYWFGINSSSPGGSGGVQGFRNTAYIPI